MRVAINIYCYITIVIVVNSYTRCGSSYRTSFQLQIFSRIQSFFFLAKNSIATQFSLLPLFIIIFNIRYYLSLFC